MSSERPQRKALGRGLSALLPGKSASSAAAPAPALEPQPIPSAGAQTALLPLGEIDPNPLQPRTVFDPGKLQELAASIRANGLIQPVIVRRKDARYELIAGERRLRAAQVAGLTEIPAVIQDYADDRVLEIALVENIQREDLNPIETAQALDRLGRELNLSHEEIGSRTGKDRTTITNLIRLLRLPPDIQILLAERRLSMGHARALLGLPDTDAQLAMANRAAAQGFSVRQVERLVQQATQKREGPDEQKDKKVDPNIRAAVEEMQSALGTRVRISEKSDDRGRIEIDYYSQDDLHRIYEHITGGRK